MTREEWNDMPADEQFEAYNRIEQQLLSLGEQVADLRKKLYLMRKMLKWKGDISSDK